MNPAQKYGLILFVLLFAVRTFAQLSPGKLTTAHKDLEGLANCTQCHDIGDKVPDQKCLDCHNEIQDLIRIQRGYHASTNVLEKECIECHSEHHGRNFDMLRFDTESFDHDLTGYSLYGHHNKIDCRDCHKPDYIVDAELKKRENTYLGLEETCLNCHDDFHQGTLSTDCALCHDFESFRPAPGFNHEETLFPLQGSHTEVTCLECHPKEVRNNLDFQIFNGFGFSDCIDCHENPHNGTWNSKCSDCHNETSFNEIPSRTSFKHNTTNFELKGGHRQIACFECHTQKSAENVFMDLTGIRENACVECHDDVHLGKFGKNCAECHNESSFSSISDLSDFDHSLTDFDLVGLHNQVECASCHTTSYTEPMNFKHCYDCHDDYHNGEFTVENIQKDCKDCHHVEQDFTFTSFGFEEHERTDFALDGAHMATACFECHMEEDKWSFVNTSTECIACHADNHEGLISEIYYPDKNCSNCHITDDWQGVTFDHQKTNWNLEGKHLESDCKECHLRTDQTTNIEHQVFNGLSFQCANCHDDPHDGQFNGQNGSSCDQCHHSFNWKPVNFNHNSTLFPLEGKHAEISCTDCHDKTYEKNGLIIKSFKIERFDCIDCHQ